MKKLKKQKSKQRITCFGHQGTIIKVVRPIIELKKGEKCENYKSKRL